MAVDDIDTQETREWLEALDGVLGHDGPDRAHYLLERLFDQARRAGGSVPSSPTTAYVNTIPPHREERSPGDAKLELLLSSIIRWNAMSIVVKANKANADVGGHIASYQSASTLYETGFNHFWHAPSEQHGGDLVYIQGHSSPGIYARAFLEGRLTEDQLTNFRMETGGGGLPSYPHPWLMPDFWQFPTVSMGLGPLMAIYQARFMKYLQGRGVADTEGRSVWCFMGDGETDEPESMGAISLAARESLDNLVFVINCNLQRLDGPVRGNGKIIQELESSFHGAGWNVVKVIWGSKWDPLLAKTSGNGVLLQRMEEAVDGEYQVFKARDGAYVREHFFGKYPELLDMVADWSDAQIWQLNRGGHDPAKVFAAYAAAMKHTGQPTVILAKTIKGYGMGLSGEGMNITHSAKKMTDEALLAFRDRFSLSLTDEQVLGNDFYKPPDDSPEMRYLRERREALGGSLPMRRRRAEPLEVPEVSAFGGQLKDTGDREISTTMAFVRILNTLLRDKKMGDRVVPIVPDESRTFGMEGMFRQFGIFSQVGQLYQPEDSDQLMYYKEDKKGQMLQEGITEAGAFSSWIAAATAYSNHGVQMVPFYIFYSMFGLQHIGDLAWAAGDSRSRGFLLGATAGRTTLNGEGLQHEDGHSHILASTIPNCVAYDPTFGYEVAVIIQDGLRRMFVEQEDVFYYVTLMNENYHHPGLPEGAAEGIVRGLYLFSEGQEAEAGAPRVQLMGSGSILNEVIAGADLLREDFNVTADVWSVPSFNELARDGAATERWNRLHPGEEPRQAYVQQCFAGRSGPVVAATDYMRAYAEQIRRLLPAPYLVLGTDGFGRSDTREHLRRFFEVDRHHVVVAALKSLADEGAVEAATVQQAIEKYGIDPDKPYPPTV